MVARLEESELGSNPRFIISSRYDDSFKLYYAQYLLETTWKTESKINN